MKDGIMSLQERAGSKQKLTIKNSFEKQAISKR
jgi:hypothetical protein